MEDYSKMGDECTPPSWDEFEACAQEEGVEVEECSLYLAWQEAEAEAKRLKANQPHQQPTVGKGLSTALPTYQDLGWGMARDLTEPGENKDPEGHGYQNCGTLLLPPVEGVLAQIKQHHAALAWGFALEAGTAGELYFLRGEFDLLLLNNIAAQYDDIAVFASKYAEKCFEVRKVGHSFDWDAHFAGIQPAEDKLAAPKMTKNEQAAQEQAQFEALKNTIQWYLSAPWAEVEKYKVGNEALHAAKVLPHSLLQRKLAPLACYRNDPLGATAALRAMLAKMLVLGWIGEIKAATAGLHYGFKGLCYKPIGV